MKKIISYFLLIVLAISIITLIVIRVKYLGRTQEIGRMDCYKTNDAHIITASINVFYSKKGISVDEFFGINPPEKFWLGLYYLPESEKVKRIILSRSLLPPSMTLIELNSFDVYKRSKSLEESLEGYIKYDLEKTFYERKEFALGKYCIDSVSVVLIFDPFFLQGIKRVLEIEETLIKAKGEVLAKKKILDELEANVKSKK